MLVLYGGAKETHEVAFAGLTDAKVTEVGFLRPGLRSLCFCF